MGAPAPLSQLARTAFISAHMASMRKKATTRRRPKVSFSKWFRANKIAARLGSASVGFFAAAYGIPALFAVLMDERPLPSVAGSLAWLGGFILIYFLIFVGRYRLTGRSPRRGTRRR